MKSAPRCTSKLLLLAFLLAAVPVRAQELLHVITGPSEGMGLGSLAFAADVDGDGHADLIVGSPSDDTQGPHAGSVRVVSLATGETLFSVHGTAGDRFGHSVAAADLDGDGLPEIVVGAPGQPPTSAPGHVRVFSGADGTELLELVGLQAGGQFGFAVSGVSDRDGDGLADLLVGAPRAHDGGLETGAAYIFSGTDGALIEVATGGEDGDRYGSSVQGQIATSPVMADVEPDVVVGIKGGDATGQLELRGSGTTAPLVVEGGEPFDGYGTAFVLTEDMDGDGVFDLLVGSDPRDATGNPTRAGYAALLSGADGTLIHRFQGSQAGTSFGLSVAMMGDLDGDGVSDVAIGEPTADVNGTDSGTVHIFSGADGSSMHVIHGPAAGARFGHYLAHTGDVDDDGRPDLAVAAPHDGLGGTDTGTVYVLSLARWMSVGEGVAGGAGAPSLWGEGELLPGTAVVLSLTNARPDASVTLIMGTSLVVDSQHGVLAPAPDEVVTGLVTGADGSLDVELLWPETFGADIEVYYQLVIADPEAPDGYARSNTLRSRPEP